MGNLQGKVAVITGGTEGIELATAQLFVKEGAYVFNTLDGMGKSRTIPAAIVGAPNVPPGPRVSAIRHGGAGKKGSAWGFWVSKYPLLSTMT